MRRRCDSILVPSLTAPELRSLLAAVDDRSSDATRDRELVVLMLDTGVRLSELVALSVGDVDLVEGRSRVMGKGSKERVVPLGGRARRAIRTSLLARGSLSADGPLFIGRQGARLTPRAVKSVIQVAERRPRVIARQGVGDRTRVGKPQART